MAASFLEEEQFDTDSSAVTTNELDDFESKQATQSQAQEAPEDTEDDLPEKYRGKTAKQIAQMHMEAEKLVGRQAQEVHSVRALADDLIKQQLKAKETTEAIKSTSSDIDFFENPQAAIQKVIEADPTVQEARLAAQQLKAMQAQAALNQKHPDFPAIVAEPEFQQWIAQSPIRQQLFQQADKGMDVNAADELFSTYKQIKQTRVQAVDANATETKKQTLKAAQVDAGGTGETSKKIYRRQDILEMMRNNPERYYSDSIQQELMKAYAENRVR